MKLKDIVDERLATGDRAILKMVRKWKTGAGNFSAFYFRSEICRKKEVPVYAVMGIPNGKGPFAGVLHYHGGGQTVNPELVNTLVQHGYAAISFDWTGPVAGRKHVTQWKSCTPRYSGIVPDESFLIRSLTAGRQALSILAGHPLVDTNRLGEFGISWGGFLTWLLNAIDDRLGAVIPIYGCGVTRDQILAYFRKELKSVKRFDPDAWMERFNPLGYADKQNSPVLFLNGTNDFFGWMNTFEKLAAQLDDRHHVAFAPHLNHAIGTLNPTLLAWLDHHLRGGGFPARPVVSGEWTRRGIELSSVALPDAESATFHVAAVHGVGPDFFWMPVAAKRSGRFFAARTAAASLGARCVLVYAHQRFARGIEQSSFPVRLAGAPGQVSASEGGPLPLTPDLWHGPASVDPLQPFTPLRPREHRGGTCLEWKTGTNLSFCFNTRMVALPCWRLRAGAQFSCRLHGSVVDPVIVAVLQYAGSPRERHFEGCFSPAVLAKGIPLVALKDTKGKSLRVGMQLSHLYIGGKTKHPGTARLVTAGWK